MSKNYTHIWAELSRELDLWADENRLAQLWLRDDDAIEPTPALTQLDQLCQQHCVPYTIASIPNFSTQTLADWGTSRRLCSVAVHGISHLNHAPEGHKKCELGLHRGLEAIVEELTLARQKFQLLFQDSYVDMLVPPWNRIDGDLIPQLSTIGFKFLSTYGWPKAIEQKGLKPVGLVQLNTHVDIIDWKGTRGGLPVSLLVANLISALEHARVNQLSLPIGILTHHLVHDELAWAFLGQLMAFCDAHKNIQWVSAKEFTQVKLST